MHLSLLPPTMLLLAAAMSSPVQLGPAAKHILATRQLDILGPLLNGIMSQNKGSPSSPNVIPSVPLTTQMPNADCAEAIQKIDQALDTSQQYMSASGNQPTIKDIQVVLAVIAGSLADDCKERSPLDDMSSSVRPNLKSRAVQKCSDCERQLYGIVKGLQQILAMTQTGMGPDQVSSVVGSVLSMTATVSSVKMGLGVVTGTSMDTMTSMTTMITSTTTMMMDSMMDSMMNSSMTTDMMSSSPMTMMSSTMTTDMMMSSPTTLVMDSSMTSMMEPSMAMRA